MKKVMGKLAMLALGLAMIVGFVACSEENNDIPEEEVKPTPAPAVEPEFTTNLLSEGQYRGDYFDSGSGNILIGISDNTIVYDENTNQFTGSGKMIALCFNTVIAENPDFAQLEEGAYSGNKTNDKGTFTLGGKSYITTYTDGKPSKSAITKGSVIVSAYGDNVYAIEGVLTTDNEKTEIYYVGKIPIYNRSYLGVYSNLTSSVQLPEFNQAALIDQGTFYSSQSDYIMLGLAGEDYTILENYGNGQCIWVGFNVNLGSAGVPSGTYPLIVSSEMGADEEFVPFTVLDGFYFPPLDGIYGSWYFYAGSGLEAAIKTGNVTVVNKGNDEYSFILDVKDGHGNSIKGNYEGSVVYIDNKY
ncbi:MAG: hypothetical protein K2M94_05470 [Paramuribaculum sp.]|nr:hypothetical protein [Paramuribaculum sp.]